MGRKEHPFVWYYNQNLHFAELLNGWLFHGKTCISMDEVSDADRRSLTRKGQCKYTDRYRDLYKCVGHMNFRLLIGVEQQEYIHYAMPVRIMDYDASFYAAQKACITSRHMETGDLDKEEYLSGFSKTDRLLPVITLVLYCGARPWDGARRLHELLDLDQVPQVLKKYVADYRIHILDIRHTPDKRLEEFPPDIRTMFLFFKYQNDPEKLRKKLAKTDDIRQDTFRTIADVTGERRLKQFIPQEKGEKIGMCKAIDILIAEGEKRGEKRGINREKKNTERQRKRAEKAEARIRELERMLNM